MPTSNLTHWDRFKLVLWKNFVVLWNNRTQLIFDIFIPLLFWISLIVIRMAIRAESVPLMEFSPVDLQKTWKDLMELIENRRKILQQHVAGFKHNCYVPQPILAFAPNTFKYFEEVSLTAARSLDGIQTKGFTNCNQLVKAMRKENYFAGVCFHNVIIFDTEYNFEDDVDYSNETPDILNISIVLPNSLRRFEDTFVGHNWLTNVDFDHKMIEIRMQSGDDGGFVGYIREGFIPLQNALIRSFLTLLKNVPIPEVTMQRFPYTEHVYDKIVTSIDSSLCLLATFGFLCSVVRITWRIAKEKETPIYSYVKAMGVKSWVCFLAWLVQGFLIFFVNSILLILVLKVKWSYNSSILTITTWSAFLPLITAYSIQATAFCQLMSSICTTPFSAATMAGSLWVLMCLPIILVEDLSPDVVKLSTILLPNTAMGMTFFNTITMEIYGDGLHWNDYKFFESANQSLCIFLVHSVVYTLIALAVEPMLIKYYGHNREWQKKLMKSSKQRGEKIQIRNIFDSHSTKVFEVEAMYKSQLVAIENLTKVYNKREVVQRVTLNLYENDITVLLGHNGAGKTTLLSMIMGIVPISQGSIRIEGYDFAKHSDLAYSNLGASLGDTLLFEDLTVENQIKFYSRLKGLTWQQAELQVNKYCVAMHLNNKRKVLTKNLTIGLRYQLAVCCALAGESKIVILDEPSCGMDLSATKMLLELLLEEKHNRTILLTTNRTVVADLVADRVAIMANGELRCSGSILFLKNIYSYGQRLNITKANGCLTEEVTKFLQKYINDLSVESDLGNSLNYLINDRYENLVGVIMEDLEMEFENLKISSYALNNLSISDVVLSMGTDYPNDFDHHRQSRILHGESPYTDDAFREYNVSYEKVKHHKQEYRALFLTRLIFSLRHKCETIAYICMPLAYIVFGFSLATFKLSHFDPKKRQFDLDLAISTKTIVAYKGELDANMKLIYDNFKEAIFWMQKQHTLDDIGDKSIDQHSLALQRKNFNIFNNQYLAGICFSNDKIETYFNNYPLHAAPISINLAYTAIARTLVSKYIKIVVYLRPLNEYSNFETMFLFDNHNFYNKGVLVLLLGCLFTWSFRVYYLTLERSTGFRLLFRIAGIRLKHFWLCTILYDVLRNTIVISFVVLSIVFFIDIRSIAKSMLIVLFLGCISIHSIHYVFSRLFQSPITCFNTVLAFDCSGIIMFAVLLEMESKFGHCFGFHWAANICTLHPYFSTGNMLKKIIRNYYTKKICDDVDIELMTTYLQENGPPRCQLPDVMSGDGILYELTGMCVGTIISWLMLIIIETNRKWLRFWVFGIQKDSSEYAWEDYTSLHKNENKTLLEQDTVTREAVKLNLLSPRARATTSLVINRVGKTFSIIEALHRLCLVLDRCHICGVLGSNGSGKSVLLKMISTELLLSYGQIHVKGIDLEKEPERAYPHIGYCPETLDAIEDFTACEIMEIYALLCGIPSNMVAGICEALAKLLGFYGYYDRILKGCSSGIQKRVGCAIALIDRRTLILLDEPSAAVDTSARLMLYNVLHHVCRLGSTVILTSGNPSECQLYCNKILMIMDGRLITCGSLTDVSRELEFVYMLQIRMKPMTMISTQNRANVKKRFTEQTGGMRLIALIQTVFPEAVLRYAGGHLLTFVVPKKYKVSNIYSTIKYNSFSYNIEAFGILNSPMENVYLERDYNSKKHSINIL